MVSPDICYRTLINSDKSQFGDPPFHSRQIPKIGFTSGLIVSCTLSKHWELESGLQYSNKGYRTKMTAFYFNNAGPESHPEKMGFIYKYDYLDIPFKVNYYSCSSSKLRFCMSLGVAANVLLDTDQREIIQYTDGHKERETDNMNDNNWRVDISLLGGLGVDWRLNDKMNLKIEPTFRYAVLSINDIAVDTYLWNAGLSIGYYHTIGCSKHER